MSKITLNHIKGLIGIGLFGFALGSAAPAMASCPSEMSGTGADADNACEVTTWTQLQAIGDDATTLGLHYKLMNDLGAADAPANFTPLGSSTNRFTGHFDGNFKRIIGLTIDGVAFNVGLFAFTESRSTISNLGLIDVDVAGSGIVGAFVGDSRGILSKVFATGKVTSTGSGAGGLIGNFHCWEGLGTYGLTDAYSLVAINGAGETGGLIGRVSGSCGSGAVKRSYTTGDVSSSSTTAFFTAIGGTQSIANTSQVYVDQLVSSQDASTASLGPNGGGVRSARTGELKRSDSFIFSTWDFDEVWAIVDVVDADETKEKISYPYLRGFPYDALDATTPVNPIPGVAAKWIPISDWAGLANINDDVTANYSLQNPLTPSLPDHAQYAAPEANSGKGWAPLGSTSSSTGYFTGRLKGNGHAIDGLTINAPSDNRVGIFVAVAQNGEVSDLTISNSSVTGSSDVGTLAYLLRDNASIKNALVKVGSVTGSSGSVGGLVARTSSDTGQQTSIIDTAVDDVDVENTATSQTLGTGGMVGSASSTKFERVYFNGSVTAPPRVGGLVGLLLGGSIIKDAYTVGTIDASVAGAVSGVVGEAQSGSAVTIENVHTAMSISHANAGGTTGGVVGNAAGADADKLANTTFFDLAQGGVVPGSGVRGKASSTAALLTTKTFTDAFWDFTNVWKQDEGDSYPYFRKAPIQNPAPKPVAITCPTGLTAASDGACLVTNWTDLTKINEKPLLTYRLTTDLSDASPGHQTNWTPLNTFGGTFDGNGKTISDLVITYDGAQVGQFQRNGLFSVVAASGVIKDLAIVDGALTVDKGREFGMIAGQLYGTIQDSYVSGTIGGASTSSSDTPLWFGGLVGYSVGSAARIERSASEVVFDVAAARTGFSKGVGGLVGYAGGISILDSYAAISIDSAGESQGGLIGFRAAGTTIVNSYSRSSFTGTQSDRGGLSGGTVATGVTSSYWDKDVTGITVSPTIGGGAPRSTLEMKSRSTFSGWDFGTSSTTGVWSIISEDVVVEGVAKKRISYPYLTKLAANEFIDPTKESDIGPIDTVTPPLELAATSPFTPAAGGTDVVPYTAIRVQFAENISAPNTSAITLKNAAGTTIASTKAVSGAAITIAPTVTLSYGETYTITVPAGVVASSADANKKNLTITWSFSTQSSTVAGGDGCPGRMINVLDPKVDGELLCAITNWGQLAAIASTDAALGLSYVLDNDLGPETEGYVELVASRSAGWTPIGTSTKPFAGVFDGNNQVINGLVIDSASHVGLFARIAKGTVKNLVLADVNVKGDSFVGGLAGKIDQKPITGGQTNPKIEKVFVSGRIVAGTSGSIFGGIAGEVELDAGTPTIFSEVGVAGKVLATNRAPAGGLIGRVSGAGNLALSAVYFVGDISGNASTNGPVGGLVGEIRSGTNVTMTDAYASANVILPGTGRDLYGALWGNNAGTIALASDVYWFDPDVWKATDSNKSDIATKAYNVGAPDDVTKILVLKNDELLGKAAETNMPSFFPTSNGLWSSVTTQTEGSFLDLAPILSGLPALPQIEGQLPDRQCSEDIAIGYGLEVFPCEISDWNGLRGVSEFPAAFYTLTADLDKNTAGYSASFTALAEFTGTFDGNNKTISDLVINQTATGNSKKTGLFSALGGFVGLTRVGGVVKNLTLADVDIKSNSQGTGALAGLMRGGEVDNVHVSGKVRANEIFTGGLIGLIEPFTDDDLTVSNSSSSVVVTAGDSGRHSFGGLIGRVDGGTVSISRVFATGKVSAMYSVGGLIGSHPRFSNLTVTDAYATGAVSGEYQLGGLIGDVRGGSYNRVYATGAVTRDSSATFGADRVGGLIGQAVGDGVTVTNAYWNAQSTAQSSSAGSDDAAGLTTAQMIGAAASTNMTGFAFGESDAWSLTTQAQTAGAFADGYPHLRAPLPLQPQLDGQNIGLGSVGISLEGVALTLFNDIISANSIELSAANTAALQAAATAASTIINVANGIQPRADLTLAMLTGIGITGVTADNLNGATIAIRAVTDTATISSVAGVQGVINAGVTAFEDAAPVFDDFFEEKPGSTPPSAGDYTNIGVKDVTTENAPAINDLLANTGIDSIDPEGIQNVVDVYNEIIDALSADPVRDPDLTAIDYAALGLGDIITNDDAADLLSSLLAEEGVTTIKAWGSATPATTFANLQSRAELAAKVIAGANGDPATPAALVTADLVGLGVDTLLTTEPQVAFFNQVIGGLTGPEVSSVETLQAMAGAVGRVLAGTANIDDYNAIGLNLTNGMLGIFDEVLGGVQETPITYATIKGIADATSNLINLAAGVGSTNPLPILEVLETLGIEVDADVIDASSEVYLAIAAADPTTLTSVAALDTLVDNAVTAANTFELTVVNGSLSGGYVSGTSVTLVANSAPEGQYFAGWTGATVADSDAPVTTLTMPAAAATVTATFQDIPEPKFNLTVASGTGAGSYEAGQQITISAALPAEGKIFDRWTGGDGVIDNPTNSVATLVMPANALTVTATYIDDPNQLFGLNVGSGAGSGEYKAGNRVAIGANPAAADKMFDRWGGDVQYIDNAANPNTRVTMPRDSVTVVAIYVDKPEPEFDLTITGGEGTGQFVAGTSITISAGIPAEGKLFDRWLGDTAYVDNVNEPNTQVTMPAGNVSLRASYADIPDPLFTLSVEGGQGDGDYEAGDVVTISAGLPPTGQIFDQWIGQTSRLGNVSQPNTTLTMPASDVSIRATYKAKPVTRFALSVTSGTGEGSYEQGQVVTIEANVPAADQVFDRWTGQTGALANVNVPNTTLVMPGSNISVTATYKADPDSTPTLGRGRGRGRSLEGGKPGPFTGRQLVDELIEEQIPAGTFVALTAPEAPVVIVNNEPVDFYFDKWVGQTAYLNNVHATTAFMVMPDHDLTVLAQFRSIDGTMTVTADGTTVTLEGAAITADSELTPGSVVQVVAAAPASGFMFDKWIGQTAYLSNVNVPETNLTVPGTNVEIRATYRRIPDGDTSVSIAGADAEAQTPGTYIALEAAAPAVGESFDLWGGQNSYVENVFAANSRMFVPATSVSVAPVYKSAFGSGVDPEAAEAILDFDGSQSTAPSAAVYESAGITGVNASNVAVYNAALVALGPTQLSEVQAVVTTYNAILAAANGNASTPATLTVADYAVLGVTVAAGEELAVVNQAVGSQSAAGVDTIAKVEAIAASAARFLTVAGGGTPSTALTPADFARLGFAGITNANIDEAIAVLVQAVSDGADPADIGTLQALFDALAPPPLPVPTLSTWMLLLMALMMWMVIQSRRALLDR